MLHHFGRGGGARRQHGTGATPAKWRKSAPRCRRQARRWPNVSRETHICASLWTIWCTIAAPSSGRADAHRAPSSTIVGHRLAPRHWVEKRDAAYLPDRSGIGKS
jgi:hypothetical protein